MTAFNIVRFRVKPGQEQAFIEAHTMMDSGFPGMRKFALVRTGLQNFCLVGEWQNFDALAAARPAMLSVLDSVRDLLEDMGMGVTDPVSGQAVVERMLVVPKPAKAKKRPKKSNTNKSAAKKKTAKKPAKKAAKKTKKKSKRR